MHNSVSLRVSHADISSSSSQLSEANNSVEVKMTEESSVAAVLAPTDSTTTPNTEKKPGTVPETSHPALTVSFVCRRHFRYGLAQWALRIQQHVILVEKENKETNTLHFRISNV